MNKLRCTSATLLVFLLLSWGAAASQRRPLFAKFQSVVPTASGDHPVLVVYPRSYAYGGEKGDCSYQSGVFIFSSGPLEGDRGILLEKGAVLDVSRGRATIRFRRVSPICPVFPFC